MGRGALRRQYGRPACARPHSPAVRARRHAAPFRRWNVGAGLPRDDHRWRRDKRTLRARGRVPAAGRAGLGTRPLPLGEPAQYAAVRGLPRLRVQALAGQRRTRGLRGVYEWDAPARAEHYARCLWRVLALVSVPGSIHYMVLPGLRRDEALATPHLLDATAPDDVAAWWRPVEAA